MPRKNLIQRILFYGIGAIVIILAIFIALLQFPRFATSLFFGVNINPVDLTLQSSYSPRETDAKTEAIVAAANDFLASLNDDQNQAIKPLQIAGQYGCGRLKAGPARNRLADDLARLLGRCGQGGKGGKQPRKRKCVLHVVS